jgi:hypothetical protein
MMSARLSGTLIAGALRRQRQAFELVPFVAGAHRHRLAEHLHLRRRHQAGVIVLVTGHRQAEALDRVADEAGRFVTGGCMESLKHRRQIVAAEIVHQRRQCVVGAFLDQPADVALVADLVVEPLAPGGAAGEHQRRVELVRTLVDPLPQPLAAGLLEGGLLQRAVFDDHHVPAEIPEQLLVALPQSFAHDGVETLPVVVDDPPAIAQTLLPAFEQRFEDVALVEFSVADQRDHAPFGPAQTPGMRAHIVLHQRGEQSLRHTQADRTGGEIDVVGILGARGIALRTLVAAECFEPFARLLAEQVLDGVEDRRGMRFHRHAVLWPQHGKIERRHDGGERGARCLMAADLQPIAILAQMIGVMDGPAREPENLLFQFA